MTPSNNQALRDLGTYPPIPEQPYDPILLVEEPATVTNSGEHELLEVILLQISILVTTTDANNWKANFKQIQYIIEYENKYITTLSFLYKKVLQFTFSKPLGPEKEPLEHLLESILKSFASDNRYSRLFFHELESFRESSYFEVFEFIARFQNDPIIEFILLIEFATEEKKDQVKHYIANNFATVSELAKERSSETDKSWVNLLLNYVLPSKHFPFLDKVLSLGYWNAYSEDIPAVTSFLERVTMMSFKDLLIEIGPENLIPKKILPSLLNLRPGEIDEGIALLLAEVLIPGSQGIASTNGGVTALTFVNNLPEANAKGAQLQACLKNIDSSKNLNWFNIFSRVRSYLYESSVRNSQPSLASVTQLLSALDFKKGLADIFLTLDWWFDKTLLFILQSMPTQRGAFDIISSPNLTLCYEDESEDQDLLKFVNIAKLEVQVMAKINAQSAQQNQAQSEGDKKFDYWLAQMFEVHCTSQPHHIIAGALAIPDKSPYILDRIDRLFAIIMDKSLVDVNLKHLLDVLVKFKELDVNLAISKLIEYYTSRMKPDSLTKVVLASSSSGLLDDLLKNAKSIDYSLYLQLAIEATNFGFDIEPVVEADSKDAKLRGVFYSVLLQLLEARTAQDFERGQQDQHQQVPSEQRPEQGKALGVSVVYRLLEVLKSLQGFVDADNLKNLQLSLLTTYPRLINFGAGHDQAILANEANYSNVFPAQVEQEMKAYYSKMYNKEMEIKDIVEMLSRMKNSDNPHNQDVFACMIHSLIDEYRFFSEYPLTALASTSLLFGALLQKDLIQGTTLTVALNFIWESCNQPQDSHLFKFAVQSLYNFKSRLHEYPMYCKHLLQCQSLSAHAKMYQIVKDASVGIPCPESSGSQQSRGETTTPVREEPLLVYNSVAQVSKNVTFAVQEEPEESVSDKLLFSVNNMTADNINSKIPDIKNLLSEKYFSWFSKYLVSERAKMEPNNHALYASLVFALDNVLFYEVTLNTTLLEVQRLLGKSKDTTTERSHLKNLGSWLGRITLAYDKPLRRDQIALKYLLLEAFDFNTLHIVIPFVCKVLDQASHSKIFRPPNPWVLGVTSVLVELYECADLKLNLKFEIEVLLNSLGLNIKSVEQSTLVRLHNPRPEALAALFGLRPEPNGLPGDTARASVEIPEQDLQAQQLQQHNAMIQQQQQPAYPPHVPQQRTFEEEVTQAPGPTQLDASFSNLSSNTVFTQNPNLRRALQASLARAVRECAVPILSRVSEAVLTTTEALVKKDFATEGDVTKFKKAYLTLAQQLTHSMVVCTGRKILIETIEATMFQLLSNQVNPNELPLNELSIAIQSNVDLCVEIVEKLAISNIGELIEERMRPEVQSREAIPPGEPFCSASATEYALQLPAPLGLQRDGLRDAQLNIYYFFGSNTGRGEQLGSQRQTPPLANSQIDAQQPSSHTLASQSMPFNTTAPMSQLPQEGTAGRGSVPPHVGSQNDEIANVDQLCTIITQMFEKAIQMLGSVKESKLSELPADHPILQTLSQALSACQSNALKHPDLLLKVAQYAVNCLFTQPHENPISSEIYVVILDRLCEYSPSTAKDVTWWMVHSVDQRKFNMPVIFSLMKVQLVSPSKLDGSIGKLIHDSQSPVLVKFAATLLLKVLSADEPRTIALRSDFAVTLAALSNFKGEDTSQEVMDATAARDELFEFLRRSNGPRVASVGDKPPSMYAESGYIFAEWTKLLGHGEDTASLQQNFIDGLYYNGFLTEPSKVEVFFKAATEVSTSVFSAEHEIRSRTQREVYLAVDCLAILIVKVVLRFSKADAKDAIEWLKTVLGVVSLVLIDEHEFAKTNWNERAYFRIFSSMLCAYANASVQDSHATEHLDEKFFPLMGEIFNSLQPTVYPGFTFAWIPLISHRMFLPQLLELPNKSGYASAIRLLTALLKFQNIYTKDEVAHNDVINVIYRAIVRIIVALCHDFPEFMVESHYQIVSAIPSNYIQLRNIILSATPSSITPEDPHSIELDINTTPGHDVVPSLFYSTADDLVKVGLKKPLDNYLRIPAPGLMRTIHAGTKLNHPKVSTDYGFDVLHYNVKLINALVIHVVTSAMEDSSPKNGTFFNSQSSQSSLIVDLLNVGSTEFRYHLICAVVNQLRFPNSHTVWCISLLTHLFYGANWASGVVRHEVQEIILRVILERIVVKTRPWGLTVATKEILCHDEQQINKLPFIKTAPQEVRVTLDTLLRAFKGVVR